MLQPIKFGKYLLLERIAVGGMAEVFVAKAFGVEGFERLLAIKKILPTMGEDPEFITMFVDEARIAVQLAHANIVQVLELGKHDDNLFIAMEYISGRDVRQLLERFRRRGEPMPIPQACTIVGKVCEALDYAHRKRDARGVPLGIVHRDVSPQNVLVSFEGDVKLIDFGIAKAESRLQRTQAGILKGKFSYMSPEQVRGQPIDHRSDVFAVGVLLWELLCGEKLFTGDSDFAVLEKVRNGSVPAPRTKNPRIPESLERVVLKALAAEVNQRYQWASELHDALMRFTLVGDIVYGARQLSEWMREEFRVEYEKEQGRLRGWLGIADQDVEVTPSDPHRSTRSRSRTPSSPQAPVPAGELTPSARKQQPPPPPQESEPEPPLVQPPTPTGVHGRPKRSQMATPPPGELRVPLQIPEPRPMPPPPVPDESHELPTMKMDGEALVAAEKALFARREAAAAAGHPIGLGEGEDESTVREAGALPRGDPAMAPTMPEGYRVLRPELPSAHQPSADRQPPAAGKPPPFGGEEKTPDGGPPASLGPNDPTPAHPVPAVAAPPARPITVRERPPPPPVPTPASGSPPVSAPAATSAAPAPQPTPKAGAAAAKQPVDLVSLANERTQPLPVQPLAPDPPQRSAFDVSDDDTAAPRAQRKAGLTRPVREPRFEAPKKSRRGLYLGLGGLVLAGAAALSLLPREEAPPGKLVVTVTPSVPAELLLDGKSAGALPPFVRTVPAGSHKVEVRAGGFKPFTTTIKVAGASRPVEVEAALQPEGPMQVEGVVLTPPGEQGEVVPSKPTRPRWLLGPGQGTGKEPPAEKTFAPAPPRTPERALPRPEEDGPLPGPADWGVKVAAPEPKAPAPRPAEPKPPEALAEARPPDAKAEPKPLEPPAPPPRVVEKPVDPASDPTRLRVTTTPPGAEVTVDDKPAGRTPLSIAGLDTSKVLLVKLALEGHRPERRVAKAEDGHFTPLAVTLVPLPRPQPSEPSLPPPGSTAPGIAPVPAPQGTVTLSATPEPPPPPEPAGDPVGYLITMTKPVAKVLVDGKDTGRWTPVAPKNPIALAPGTHTIVFETAQGRRHEEKVTIEVGKTTRLIKMDL